MERRINCLFYGRALAQNFLDDAPQPFLLIDSRGNQCALVTRAHAPCRMEIEQHPIDWETCPLVKAVRP